MEAKSESTQAPESWSSHPVYARYWQHYHQAMAWMRSHQSAYQKAVESVVPSPWDACRRRSRPGKPGPQRRSTEKPARFAEDNDSESDDCGIVCDLSNMVITDELRQYFAETEQHQEELRRQHQLDAARLKDYVNADHGLYCDKRGRSTLPPTERPGERRQAEMKRLYGASAAKIQAMETAMQLSFDKHCDRKQPKYWPVIPLKF
nr:gem-associated protein 8 isoform X2 [Bubalus bubalis]